MGLDPAPEPTPPGQQRSHDESCPAFETNPRFEVKKVEAGQLLEVTLVHLQARHPAAPSQSPEPVQRLSSSSCEGFKV